MEAETEDRPGRLRRVSFVLEAPPEDPSDLAEGSRNAQAASPDQLAVFLPDENEIILPGYSLCPFRLRAAEKAAGVGGRVRSPEDVFCVFRIGGIAGDFFRMY